MLNLQLQRQAVTLNGEKWITPNLLFETTFKNEDKNGARLSGEGMYCSPGTSGLNGPNRYLPCSSASALLMLPEPVNTTTKQIDAKLNYSGSKFLVSGGYYGSFFSNSNGSYNLNPNSPYLIPIARRGHRSVRTWQII